MGVEKIYLDGNFTTTKVEPEDIDGCWTSIGVNLKKLDFRFGNFERAEEFKKNRSELKELVGIEGESGKSFPIFFQRNPDGEPKGMIRIDLQD